MDKLCFLLAVNYAPRFDAFFGNFPLTILSYIPRTSFRMSSKSLGFINALLSGRVRLCDQFLEERVQYLSRLPLVSLHLRCHW